MEIIVDNLTPVQPVVNPAANVQVQKLISQINTSKRRDFASSSKRLSISQVMPSNARDNDKYAIHIGDQYHFGMSGFCFKQLNQKLSKGFASYASELDGRGMSDLYLENVNRLLREDPRQAQVRVLQNGQTYARAVVSDKYMAIDDHLVFGSAFNVLQNCVDKFKPLGGKRTDTKTYCKFISREPMFELEIGGKTRAFSAGFMISNSEVGQGNALFEAFFTDHYCSNGIIFSKSVIAECRFKHIGSRISTQFGELLGKNVNSVRNAEISEFITEATKIAIIQDKKVLEPIKRAILESSNRKLQGDEMESIQNVLAKVGVPKTEFPNVIRELDSADNSQFGIQAALTQYAQKVDSYEKRIDFEKKGGEIINLNTRQWEALQAFEAI